MEKFRFYALIVGFVSSVVLLQACGGGGGDTPASGGNPTGVSLNSIGDKSIAPGTTLSFTLSSSNPDNNNISYSSDTSHEIYTARNASFTPGSGQFSWQPSVADLGTYQVRFTVTNDDEAIDYSETVTISVESAPDPTVVLGESRYKTYCESCHGVNGRNGQQTLVYGVPPAGVRYALTLSPMTNFGLSSTEVSAIGFFLCTLAVPAIDYTNPAQCAP